MIDLGEGVHLVAGDAPIRTIVSLRTNHSDASLAASPSTVQLEHISVQSWHLEDEDVVRFLRIATDPVRQPVLVHCRRGADRTGAMVAIIRSRRLRVGAVPDRIPTPRSKPSRMT